MGDIASEKVGYLVWETKSGPDFCVSRDIEEFDSVYEKNLKILNASKKIQKMIATL